LKSAQPPGTAATYSKTHQQSPLQPAKNGSFGHGTCTKVPLAAPDCFAPSADEIPMWGKLPHREYNMMDLFIALAFIGVVFAPALVASRQVSHGLDDRD